MPGACRRSRRGFSYPGLLIVCVVIAASLGVLPPHFQTCHPRSGYMPVCDPTSHLRWKAAAEGEAAAGCVAAEEECEPAPEGGGAPWGAVHQQAAAAAPAPVLVHDRGNDGVRPLGAPVSGRCAVWGDLLPRLGPRGGRLVPGCRHRPSPPGRRSRMQRQAGCRARSLRVSGRFWIGG